MQRQIRGAVFVMATIICALWLLGSCRISRIPSSTPQVIGGVTVDDDRYDRSFASVLRLPPGCSAVKIGMQWVLTAAHCVSSMRGELLQEAFQPADGTITVEHGLRASSLKSWRLPLKQLFIHKSFVSALHQRPDRIGTEIREGRASDVALLNVCVDPSASNTDCRDFAKVPSARLIDRDSADELYRPGTGVLINGYGKSQIQPLAQRFSRNIPAFDGSSEFGKEETKAPHSLFSFAAAGWDRIQGSTARLPNRIELRGIGLDQQEYIVLSMGSGDSGGALFWDNRSPGADIEDHFFSYVLAVNSLTLPRYSYFSLLDFVDEKSVGTCTSALLESLKAHSDCWWTGP